MTWSTCAVARTAGCRNASVGPSNAIVAANGTCAVSLPTARPACEPNVTFGCPWEHSRQMWVSHGCKAHFWCKPGGNDHDPVIAVKCEHNAAASSSRWAVRKYCSCTRGGGQRDEPPPQPVTSPRCAAPTLLEQLSPSPCVLGISYGCWESSSSVWTRRGCHGTFRCATPSGASYENPAVTCYGTGLWSRQACDCSLTRANAVSLATGYCVHCPANRPKSASSSRAVSPRLFVTPPHPPLATPLAPHNELLSVRRLAAVRSCLCRSK